MKIISGAQPTGILHIGNYFGAIKQWVELQNENECLFPIVDLHALTENPNPADLEKNILNCAIDYLALGVDPKKSSIFIQSHIKEHLELFWILNTITPIGELFRMTQFKDKSRKMLKITAREDDWTASEASDAGHEFEFNDADIKGSINAGLLNYPVLMAADIMLYHTEAVPVGEDQLQHLELTRTLVRKFNSKYGEYFKEPKSLVSKIGARIMALDNPLKKMSKSGSFENYIGVFDDEKTIFNKIKISVTDSGKEIKYDKENKPGISNLLEIYSLCSDKTIKELEKEFEGKGYAQFKEATAKSIAGYFTPFREEREKLAKNPKKVLKILEQGEETAQAIAKKTMEDVRQKIGLI